LNKEGCHVNSRWNKTYKFDYVFQWI
jgi:hypothetical protein